MDAMFAMKKAKDRAWQIQKLPGETDEEFRRRKELERKRKKLNLSPIGGRGSAADWAEADPGAQ